jgi:hypothetical protein
MANNIHLCNVFFAVQYCNAITLLFLLSNLFLKFVEIPVATRGVSHSVNRRWGTELEVISTLKGNHVKVKTYWQNLMWKDSENKRECK